MALAGINSLLVKEKHILILPTFPVTVTSMFTHTCSIWQQTTFYSSHSLITPTQKMMFQLSTDVEKKQVYVIR
jgi:hypothetical protein